ncbi:TPA: ead/Ea22-like family protein [Enterobacter ludwigii]
MSNIDKQTLTDEAISKAFAGTNFGRDDVKNILAETVIDAAAGWRCGYTATTICTQLGLLTPKGCASALGLRFISEHVQRETKRLKDELEAAEQRIAELQARLETADKLQDSAFRHGLQHGFSLGQTDNQAGFEQAIHAYGQQWKGE